MQQAPLKPPRFVFDTIFAFPPNRETMGGTSYFIVENSSNILVDCPTWNDSNRQFLQNFGGLSWLFLSHRGAIDHVQEIQQVFGCNVLIQEQEAYLLPGLTVKTFQHEFSLSSTTQAIWTPGYSPGSACLYHSAYGGVLFTGRHLLPNSQGEPVPLRIAKTFHWRRQITSVQKLRDRFTSDTLHHLCPAANTGFLRGQRTIDRAYEKLARLDLDACLQAKPML
ncbi:MAG: MBL fold metallo-hydrolase [Cyanobacteria bacterium CRU_2_1]|nr:MBL fold metallo-hydrolase [Cyanobacteria bacterium RU_5_0]NJR60851.1 MBL fold metallo-hydrolase [Cyanobacteria bacterium CRU_2_1]